MVGLFFSLRDIQPTSARLIFPPDPRRKIFSFVRSKSPFSLPRTKASFPPPFSRNVTTSLSLQYWKLLYSIFQAARFSSVSKMVSPPPLFSRWRVLFFKQGTPKSPHPRTGPSCSSELSDSRRRPPPRAISPGTCAFWPVMKAPSSFGYLTLPLPYGGTFFPVSSCIVLFSRRCLFPEVPPSLAGET